MRDNGITYREATKALKPGSSASCSCGIMMNL